MADITDKKGKKVGMVQVCCEEIPSRHLARFGKFQEPNGA